MQKEKKMSKVNPYSAIYYIRKNKGKSAICIFMMFLATFMFLAGNYIDSELDSFDKEFEYSDRLVVAEIQSTDPEYQDFAAFRKAVLEDDALEFVDVTAYGFGGMQHGTVLNLEMGGWSYVFNSVDDCQKVFEHLGIEGDLSNCKSGSIILGKEFAKNKGIKLGDVIDHSFDSNLNGEYRVDAIVDDDSYCTYYIYENDESLGRLYIYSDTLDGKALYDYVNTLAQNRNVHISKSEREETLPQFSVFYVLFYMIDLLIGIVLAVTVNSVITGQYLKRVYEFGVYRALGRSKGGIKKKVAKEILLMNFIACAAGAVVISLFTYIINELYYKPMGIHLLAFSQAGLLGFLLCDVFIVVPLILSKGRMMSKADVTEF
jgi:ABC-type lipoprotein release transport system permease subunit